MTPAHFAHWPPGLPRHLSVPATHLFHNVQVSAARYPAKPFMLFYGTPVTFSRFRDEAERLAGFLQRDCGVAPGDRVLIFLQNCPQWAIAFYGILRAGAVAVPINPMNTSGELAHYVADSGARVAVTAQDMLPRIEPLLGAGLDHLVVATYADYTGPDPALPPPSFVLAPPLMLRGAGLVQWSDALNAGRTPAPLVHDADALGVLPYTSGTTGRPRGCMHTHRSVMCTSVGGINWFARTQDAVYLSTLPFFHVTGLAGSLNGPMYAGATIVVLARWDRELAAAAIERYRVSVWQSIATMMIDFLGNPRIGEHDLSSLALVRGGGAAMPEAIGRRLKALTGLDFVEGYGMTETFAATHINPPQRPKVQCLGVPVFDVDARIVDHETLAPIAPGEVGEIVVDGPQLMQGYWHDPVGTQEAFVTLDGRRFLRTGDLGRVDDDGYFFMADRLKRMINASGYKVWPAEVEAMMYDHPAIEEACVVATRDERRGETVKAVVVLKAGLTQSVCEQEIVAWAHARMAAYKVPRVVEFVPSLPKSGSGKVLWRELQERELARASAPPS